MLPAVMVDSQKTGPSLGTRALGAVHIRFRVESGDFTDHFLFGNRNFASALIEPKTKRPKRAKSSSVICPSS
jgi:hypothetical protein